MVNLEILQERIYALAIENNINRDVENPLDFIDEKVESVILHIASELTLSADDLHLLANDYLNWGVTRVFVNEYIIDDMTVKEEENPQNKLSFKERASISMFLVTESLNDEGILNQKYCTHLLSLIRKNQSLSYEQLCLIKHASNQDIYI